MSQETSTAAEESAAHAEFPKFPRRVTQSMVDHLDILFDFVHPYDLKRYINWVLLHYIMHEADQPDDDTKDIVQSYIMLLDWLDTADLEMESLGFGRPL